MSKKVIRECLRCGKPFEAYPSRDKYGKGQYCSMRCSRNSLPNEFYEDSGVIHIKLTRGKEALIDAADYPLVSQYRWHAQHGAHTFYANTTIEREDGSRTALSMHQLLLQAPPGLEIDHENGNGCDDRRQNIHVVTRRVNQQNQHIEKSSLLPGVTRHKQFNKWRSQIQIDKKRFNLGLFDSEEEAHEAYVNACIAVEAGTFSPPALYHGPRKKEKDDRLAASRIICIAREG